MKKYIISASILSADFSQLGSQIARAEKAGIDWVHIDVMDGRFVPNITMGPFIVEACRKMTGLPLDVHLMITHPEDHLEAFASAGASILSVHTETCPNLHRTMQRIKELGCKAGVVINPGTPASAVSSVLHLADLVLVMTVNPGYSGQKFLPETTPKVAEIRRMLNEINSEADLEVDGGINTLTLPSVQTAGANAFVAASAIFHHPDGIEAGVNSLKEHFHL
jgi:ribulose-phosphate 3-epimerase